MQINPYVRATVDFLKSKGILKDEKIQNDDLMYICPFHHGEHQNFGINSISGKWNCLKCKKRGRSASELMDRLGITDSGITPGKFYEFVDVRKQLLESFQTGKRDFAQEREEVTAALPITCELKEAPAALAYIAKRGMDPELLASFGVLYSPFGEYGRRLIIPWYEGGRLVGFSARSIDSGEYIRKMLRPSGSKQELFLYNPTGRPFKGARLILSEGEFSSFAWAHLGYHACCTFGSYLHPGQISWLIQAEEVTFAFDPDQAGIDGTAKGLKALGGFVPYIRAIILPGQDPADLFLADPNSLEKILAQEKNTASLVDEMKKKLKRP